MIYQQLGMLIRERIEKYRDRIAMYYKDEEKKEWVGITWKEMGEKIQFLSKALIKLGVKEQQNVAIFSQNMPEWTLADLAIMGIRGVTVPIYATNSTTEAKYILQDASVDVLFVGEQEQYDRAVALFDEIPDLVVIAFDASVKFSGKGRSMYFSDLVKMGQDADCDQEVESRLKEAQLSDLATLIYTSGTTGEPKGVMLDHQNFIGSLECHDEELNVSEEDVSLSFLPLSHVYERSWVLFCLHRGISIYINRDPKKIAEVMKEVKPTLMCTVPRIFEKIYAAIHDKRGDASLIKNRIMDWALKVGGKYYNYHMRFDRPVPASLKRKHKIADKLVLSKLRGIFGARINFMPCGGAPLSPEIVEFFHSTGINIKCGYGLTETTATVALFGDKHFLFNSVGKTLTGTQIKIGENDEIMVKGPGVMRGYYKKPEETAKVIKDGWFCTGDAGKMDEKGNLVITDRIKDLMKTSGGKYIAPQKLEVTLTNDQFIEQVAVIGDCRKYVTALAVPALEPLKQYAEKKKIVFETIEELISHAQIVEFFEKRFEDLQKEFSRFEKIKKFTLLPREFSMEAGEVTSTLKLKRKVIQEKYKHLIEKMYKD
ncbi:MAG: long-chain fatty acid--CoA ligase [Marinifilaceae bacterium]